MAYIPGETTPFQSQTFNIDVDSVNGSGIDAFKDQNGVEQLSLALVAGANIGLIPKTDSKKLLISKAVPASIAAIQTTNGSGITEANAPPDIAILGSSLIEPSNGSIILQPSTTNKDLTIINNQKRTTSAGSGITLTGSGPSYGVSLSLATIGINNLPIILSNQRTLVNAGVRSITAGTGVSVSANTGVVSITNTTNPVPPSTSATGSGVNQQVVGGNRVLTANLTSSGFDLTPSTIPNNPNIQLSNPGVISVAAGLGIGVVNGNTNQDFIVGNNGIRSISSSSPSIQNIGTANDVVLRFIDPSPNAYGTYTIPGNRNGAWNPTPVGQTGGVPIGTGALLNQHLRNGDPNNPNSVWLLDMSSLFLGITSQNPTGSVALSLSVSLLPGSLGLPEIPTFTSSTNPAVALMGFNVGMIAINPNVFVSTFPGNFGNFVINFTNNTNANIVENWVSSIGGTAFYYPKGIS
jgi:hypothetical protein